GGEIDPEHGLVDLAAHPGREEVAARVRPDRGCGSVVALELEREAARCSRSACAGQPFRRPQVSVEGRVVEFADVPLSDRAAVEDRKNRKRIGGIEVSGDGEVERLVASNDASEIIADCELLHLDVDPEWREVAADDLRLLDP